MLNRKGKYGGASASSQAHWRKLQSRGKSSNCDLRVAFLVVLCGLVLLEGLLLSRTSPSQSNDDLKQIGGLRQESSVKLHHPTPASIPVQQEEEKGIQNTAPAGEKLFPKFGEDPEEPQLDELMKRIVDALKPMQTKYWHNLAQKRGEEVPACDRTGYLERVPDTFLPGCPNGGCKSFSSLDEAKAVCDELVDCGGITVEGNNRYSIRSGQSPRRSEAGEDSIPKNTCHKEPTRMAIWDSFYKVVDESLADPELHLSRSYGPARTDNSIYLSIASYRDPTCRDSLRQAFERASHPDKLFVGIVQQNCNDNCMTGTGWGNTRRWVPGEPDPDCAYDFCASSLGRKYCEAGQVRILRFEEAAAMGPFFTRFLNAKMWRGENFYMQIDAHTEFRKGWDESLVAQMRKTPSYPYSVLSNYPPGGSPAANREWPVPKQSLFGNREHEPSALCGCTFENAGGHHSTVRLTEIQRSFSSSVDKDVPHHSLFVAAGFFFTHGSIVDRVPFDPFMPYLFMGEEIALSVRLWTSGYDIYGPSENVLRHEYVRKEHPKFWETITMVYSKPIHNELTDLIIPRVQHLVRFPEAKEPESVQPISILDRIGDYWLGNERPIEQYLEMAQMDLKNKRQSAPSWCVQGLTPTYTSDLNKRLPVE